MNKHFVRILIMTLGGILYGAALGLLLNPNHITPGGVAGLSVILSSFIPWGVGTFTVLLNIPLLIIGAEKFGKVFLFSTLYVTVLSGAVADMCAFLEPLTDEIIPAALAGGALFGSGVALVFKAGGTTGGTDIAAKLIKRKKPYIKTAQIFLLIDGAICILGGIVFSSFGTAMYSFLTLGVFSKAFDLVLYGQNSGKLAFVISEKSDLLIRELLSKADVGCTVLYGRSGYEGSDKRVIMCVCGRQKFTKVRQIVTETDKNAFMLVSNTAEILGKGFEASD